ncbi:MAG TPA: NTP transferase domain-containing protein [Pirellulaceae bacterium]|jgi:bifunctional UDP-N-acetylglucosamine pyrophosphorylase/glucosamine-1-phosphate N-acetyltransferase/UDP-N-acetylglucosamine pyrophosphorylase|nr:NTP transferase domain-containing protein [Pirellulaceae bacterium]
MKSSPLAVVLAAGKGTRMRSETPKVLCEALGRPLVDYVLDALADAGVGQAAVVVGYRADDVRTALAERTRPAVEFFLQDPQHGTGHAVQCARPALERATGSVVVVAGDSPMLQSESVARLIAERERRGLACLLGTLVKDDPQGLGRIVRDEAGQFLGIVEERDATAEQRAIREVNMSLYVFDVKRLLFALDRLKNDNSQSEYYVTDCPAILREAGDQVDALACLKPVEAFSVNTPEELTVVEERLRAEASA